MAVYVDGMQASYRRMIMSHMVADSTDELLHMADQLGLKRGWIQKAGTPHEHFDLCQTKRTQAIQAGAIVITTRQLVELIRLKRRRH